MSRASRTRWTSPADRHSSPPQMRSPKSGGASARTRWVADCERLLWAVRATMTRLRERGSRVRGRLRRSGDGFAASLERCARGGRVLNARSRRWVWTGLGALGAVAVGVAGVALGRAAWVGAAIPSESPVRAAVDATPVAKHLAGAIRFQTIAVRDGASDGETFRGLTSTCVTPTRSCTVVLGVRGSGRAPSCIDGRGPTERSTTRARSSPSSRGRRSFLARTTGLSARSTLSERRGSSSPAELLQGEDA